MHTLKGHSDWVRSVAFFPNGKSIFTESEYNLDKIWDTQAGALVSSFVRVL